MCQSIDCAFCFDNLKYALQFFLLFLKYNYTKYFIFVAASEKCFRKHVLCLKTDNISRAQNGVVNIVAVQLSKGEQSQRNVYTIS